MCSEAESRTEINRRDRVIRYGSKNVWAPLHFFCRS